MRLTTTGSHRWCDQHGREHALRDVLAQHIGQPGQRWRARGCLFKDAGWRRVDVVALWAVGHKEALVVITDLGARWEVRGALPPPVLDRARIPQRQAQGLAVGGEPGEGRGASRALVAGRWRGRAW